MRDGARSSSDASLRCTSTAAARGCIVAVSTKKNTEERLTVYAVKTRRALNRLYLETVRWPDTRDG